MELWMILRTLPINSMKTNRIIMMEEKVQQQMLPSSQSNSMTLKLK